MEFTALVDARGRTPSECAVVGMYEGGELGAATRHLDQSLGGALARLHGSGDFAGKLGDTLLLPQPRDAVQQRVLLVGLGPRPQFTRKPYRQALKSAATALLKTGAREAIVYLALEDGTGLDVRYRARIAAETMSAQAYRINDLKSQAKPKAPKLATVAVAVDATRSLKAASEGLRAGVALAHGAAFTRDLANLPPNVCTPTYLGERAEALAKEFPRIKTRLYDEDGIRSLKMGAFLAVTQGSAQPPRLIVCEYSGARKAAPPVCLIGKGITFDSGGISLKDPPGMDEMKFDMSGAAAVLGVLRAAAELALPMNLVGIIAACENMPSGTAVKPSDIVTSMSGQTVEILNTDAEGRLVLCDAITFSRRFKPDTVVDIATLTGACIIALGNHYSGLMSNDDALAEELLEAGQRADDRAWHLPIGDEYVEQLKSN